MLENNRSGNGLSVQWLQGLERPDHRHCWLRSPGVGDTTATLWTGENLPAQNSIE